MRFVAVRILSIFLALAPGLVFAGHLPECDSYEIKSHWENPEERLLENISKHIEEARHHNSSYIDHYVDLACFTRHYFYFHIESEKEREERVKTILDLGANVVYRAAATDAEDAESSISQYYYENILCELHLLAYLPRKGDCSKEAVPILIRLIKANEEAREKNKQSALAALTKLKSEILKKIKLNWSKPVSFTPGLEVKLLIQVRPSGEVISADVVRGSGSHIFDVSAELAAKKASPLPFPEEPHYYEFIQEFEFMFRPEEPSFANLLIQSNVSNARVYVDGELKGITPLSRRLRVGTYTVKVEKDGYVSQERLVYLGKNKNERFDLSLEPKPEPTTFRLTIQSNPSKASVWIDGSYRGTTPVSRNIAKGSHRIKVTKPGYKDWEQTITLSSDKTLRATDVRLEKKKPPTEEKVDIRRYSGAYKFLATKIHIDLKGMAKLTLDVQPNKVEGRLELDLNNINYRIVESKLIGEKDLELTLRLLWQRGNWSGWENQIKFKIHFDTINKLRLTFPIEWNSARITAERTKKKY